MSSPVGDASSQVRAPCWQLRLDRYGRLDHKDPIYAPPGPALLDDIGGSCDSETQDEESPFYCEGCQQEELCENSRDEYKIPVDQYCAKCQKYFCYDCMGEQSVAFWTPFSRKRVLHFCTDCVVSTMRRSVDLMTRSEQGQLCKRRKLLIDATFPRIDQHAFN